MNFLQFRKVMNAGRYYLKKNHENKVPWGIINADMTLDLIDEYMEFKTNTDHNDAVSLPRDD